MLYSYDIFDTSLSRLYAYPRDLFLDLGFRLTPSDLPDSRRLRMARNFRRRRVLAERIAYVRSGAARTATLDDIYANFLAPSWLGVAPAEIKNLEQALELDALYEIPAIAGELKALIAKGERVVFMSDMYLDSRFVSDVFRRLELGVAGCKIYISSEARVTKLSGRLFQMVLVAEGVQPEQWVHVGDDMRADVRAAQAHGLRARHFAHSALTHHERILAGERHERTPARSQLVGLSRKWRLHAEHHTNPIATRESIAYGTVAPLLLHYVLWVLRDAQARGIRRLYCVARDGELLYLTARCLAPLFPEIEAVYLHGSRRAWIPASILSGDTTWREFAFVVGERNRAIDLLARLGFGADESEQVRRTLGILVGDWGKDLSRRDAMGLLDALMDDPGLAQGLLERSARQRGKVLSYFAQQRMFDGTPWALVDLGWAFNCQAALGRIVSRVDGFVAPVRGYYFGAGAHHLPAEIAGDARWLLSERGSIFARRAIVVEHVFTPAGHPTTVGYTRSAGGSVEPLLGAELRPAEELEYARILARIMQFVAKDYVGDARTRRIIDESSTEIVQNAARLLMRPTQIEAQAFSAFGAVADPRHEAALVRTMCQPMSLRAALRLGFAGLSGRPTGAPTSIWPEASAVLSPTPVRMVMHGMQGVGAVMRRFRNNA
jgi:FMN phosphatase YigB (HAD superfamily)